MRTRAVRNCSFACCKRPMISVYQRLLRSPVRTTYFPANEALANASLRAFLLFLARLIRSHFAAPISQTGTSIQYTDKKGIPYQINIVDTPGHADFGGEVVRLRVLLSFISSFIFIELESYLLRLFACFLSFHIDPFLI